MIELYPHQDDFLYSNAIHTGLVGGFGCGKSFIGTLKIVSKKMAYPGINVAYYLPTYKLIKDIAFDNISKTLEAQNIKYVLNRTDTEFLTPLGKIIMRSMDRPDNIVGYEVGYSLVDEADIPPKDKMNISFKNIVARNRVNLPDGAANSTDFVSTPEGFKFLYDFFIKKPSKNKVLINGKTSANKSLPDSYIETLRESYTEEQLAAYLNGEFVNLTAGTVYHTFDRKRNHTDREIKPREVLHVGMDFNITKMSAVIHVIEKGKKHAASEVTGAYDTADMITILKERFPNHKIVVYPDASGNARNTAGPSDIALLKKARFTVRVKNTNPSVRDRITTVNAGFLNAKGETDYYVNTHNCPEYTEALEKLAYKNGVPDKESGFDHVTDGGGYCYYNLKKSTTTRINV
ncbi:terminase large subunit domain-containing protein [Aquimarina intermedia]|uniref:Terminase family protein n=1 Tax=Aquimarina intermedia TaxID=350814 RepID=A0A5S5BZ58_9FLAO|nr:terminase family protein [Aquimarina intermedia]TYP71496.1 terminase family protein [Aquimarina intermedia]